MHVPDGTVAVDTEPFRLAGNVDVRPDEDELPALLPLPLDQPLYLAIRVAAARILHTIRRDDEKYFVRFVARRLHALHEVDMVDGPAHRVEQRRAAAAAVLVPRERLDAADIHAVVEHARMIVEYERGHDGLARSVAVLGKHCVEASHGVVFQT